MRIGIRGLSLVVCFTFVPIVAYAQWTDSASINTPVAVAPNDQQLPTTVPDGAGGVVVAWVDRRGSASDPEIYGQRLNANGHALWTSGGKPICSIPGDQTDPSACSDGAGGMVVAWVDQRGTSRDIYAQSVSGAGTLRWTSGGVAVVSAGGDQLSPQIVADGDGGAIVVWQDGRNDAGDVYAQRMSAVGLPLWPTNGVSVCFSPGTQYDVVAIADGAGGVFIGWADERSGNADIYVQHLDSSGSALWPAGGVSAVSLPEQQYKPSLVLDGSGGVITAWVDWRNGAIDTYVQRFSASGDPRWSSNGLFVGTIVENQFDLLADDAGGAFVGYVGGGANSLDIYVSRLDSTGGFPWTPPVSLISDGSPAVHSAFSMVSDGSGGGIVLWGDSRSASGWDLYAQRFDAAGGPLWDLSGRPVSTAPLFQGGSQGFVSDQRGGGIVVFDDNRNLSDDDLYAQRIRSDGELSVSTAVGLAGGWNLVSIPRHVAVKDVDSLFPGNISVFALSGLGYQQVDTLVPGQGVWVRFPSPGLFEFDGAGVDSLELTVPAANRWVILGSLPESVPVTALQSIPPGAVLPGSVYEFDGTRYLRAEWFSPGKAYWVFVTQPCHLLLRSPSR